MPELLNELDSAEIRAQAEEEADRLIAQAKGPRPLPFIREELVKSLVRNALNANWMTGAAPVPVKVPRFSVSGLLARLVLLCQDLMKKWHPLAIDFEHPERAAQYSKLRYKVQSSGAIGVLIMALVATLMGVIGFLSPLDTVLQIGRDAMRRTAASGDIIVVAKDYRSAKIYGSLPWPRRYDAQLVDKLHEMGAKRIVFNQVMADSSNQEDDTKLAAAFDRTKGKVWLSVSQEYDPITQRYEPLLPIPLLRTKTQQAHFIWQPGLFRNVKSIKSVETIGRKNYLSTSAALSGLDRQPRELRPNFAIDSSTIPTLSASDVIAGKIQAPTVEGKTIIVGTTSDRIENLVYILGQSYVPGVYIFAIGAETLKRGPAQQWGYALPLIMALLICLICTALNAPSRRAFVLALGVVAVLAIALIGDQLSVHMEVMPALFLLIIAGIGEAVRRKNLPYMRVNDVSGFPNLWHLRRVKGYRDAIVVAVKIDFFDYHIDQYTLREQRQILTAIQVRIDLVLPGCVLHQSEDGMFVVLVPRNADVEIDAISGQLHLLFSQEFRAFKETRKLNATFAVEADSDHRFEQRLWLACDRAERAQRYKVRLVR